MKSRIVFGLAIGALVVSTAGVHAQLGGLLKKKAGDLLKGKPAPTETTPAPTPSPAPAETAPAPAPAPGSGPPAPARATAAAAPAKSTDPLDFDNLRLADHINRYVRDEHPVPDGEWSEVPYFGKAAHDALKALDDAGRVAFVEKAGAAVKALAMSETFADAHAAAIKGSYKAVDHGLKGLVGPEAMMAKKDFAAYEAFSNRQSSLTIVENVGQMSADDITRTLGYEIESWRRSAQSAAPKNRPKYERFVRDGEAILAMSDVTAMRRGYAVIRSIDRQGPATEAALYAEADRARMEAEQIAWDEHNLRSVLRQQLGAFVKVAASVDFAAQTVEKNGQKKFVNAAYERKGSVWKACFRAGKPAVTAAQQLAQAWLKEL
jgi:hypothetical protein